MYGLLTKCEVKMAGYCSFFECLWTETKSRSINSQKRTRPISSHLDRTNLVNKGFILWLLGKFCLRDSAGSPELHLARSGSQSQCAISFILPARGASHIINICYLPAGRSVWWKTVTEGLKMLPEAAAEGSIFMPEVTVFHHTDQP